MKIEFYVFRHGQTDWNQEKRIQGHTDIPLNEIGRRQAKGLIPIFEKTNLEVIYSSDLSRAVETGNLVANALGIELKENEKLREAFFGEAEGLRLHEIHSKFGKKLWEDFRIVAPEMDHVRFPGGESRGESRKRVLEVVDELISNGKYKKIGISTHGGVLRNFLHHFMEEGSAPLKIPNCAVYKLEYDSEIKTWEVSGPIT